MPTKQWSQLKVPRDKFDERVDRMQRMIQVDAPPIVLWMGAKSLLDTMHYPYRIRLRRWALLHVPHWILWLLSPQHRRISKELKSFEVSPVRKNEWLIYFAISQGVIALTMLAIWAYGHFVKGW